MTDNTDLFEYLFAVRISLQDDFENESDIIRELKLTLRDMGMGSEQSNQLLHDFYQAYGIDISLDTIKQASTTSNQLLNNMLGFMLSPGDFAHSGHPDDGYEHYNNNDEDEDEDDDEDENDDENNHNNQNLNQLYEHALLHALGINVTSNASTNDTTNVSVPNNENVAEPAPDANATNTNVPNTINSANISLSINGNTYTFSSNNQQLISGLLNNPNVINTPITQNAPMMNINQVGTHGSMINVINSLLQGSHNNFLPIPMPSGPNMFSDVVVSTDGKDLESLKTFKLESKLETGCSICMGCLDKDEEVSELKCSHTFHTECIKPYLREYNYKCPVCRAEVGKAKYNI